MMRATMLLLPAAMLIAALSTPVMAAPKCDEDTFQPGVHFSFGVRIGSPYTREEQEIFDKMELRKQGVNARTVTRTSEGCLEAWVPDGNGHFHTEYYDPGTFELKLD